MQHALQKDCGCDCRDKKQKGHVIGQVATPVTMSLSSSLGYKTNHPFSHVRMLIKKKFFFFHVSF